MRPDDFKAYFKACSTALRRTSRWPDGHKATLSQLTQCAYWEMCTGRSANISDWPQEILNRTTTRLDLRLPCGPDTRSFDSDTEYRGALHKHVTDIINELVPTGRYDESWVKAVQTRQTWIASGSAGNAKIEIMGKRYRINKHSYFENLSDKEMISWLTSDPRVDAVASDKLEPMVPLPKQ